MLPATDRDRGHPSRWALAAWLVPAIPGAVAAAALGAGWPIAIAVAFAALALMLRRERRMAARLVAALAAARESERRFHEMAELAGDWIWATDDQHRFRSFTGGSFSPMATSERRLTHLLGRTRWELAGADPETDEHWRQHKADLDARRPFRNFRCAVPDRGGEQRHLCVSGRPVFAEDGAFLGYRGAASDETAIVEARRRVEAAEAFFREAVNSIPQSYTIFDRDDRLVLCNDAYRQANPEHSVPGTRFEDVVRDRVAKGYYRDAVGREEAWLAERMRRHLNPEGPFEVHFANDAWGLLCERRMSDGSTASLRIDITALKATQAALRRSQEHLVRAQRLAGMGSAELDYRSGRVEWSEGTLHIFGLDPRATTPSTELFLSLVHEDDRDRVAQSLERARNADPAPIEYRIRRPNGEIRRIYREGSCVRNEAGEVTGLIITQKDVTELRAAEERRYELEALLRHTQKLDALGTLAGGVAHDLNNTMVPVIALSKTMMSRHPPESRERSNLQMIYESGCRARDLVRQILAFSRKEEIRRETLDLDAFVRATLQMIRASVPATIRVDYAAASGLAPVLGDPSQLHQVLINLVTNAVHAIGDAQGTIAIALAPAARPERALCLTVGDTGCGMSKATMQRMFDPFFTTKSVGEGTGLGLAVVHGIVAGHGGRITVESEQGLGTRFHVFLPAAEPAGKASPEPLAAAS